MHRVIAGMSGLTVVLVTGALASVQRDPVVPSNPNVSPITDVREPASVATPPAAAQTRYTRVHVEIPPQTLEHGIQGAELIVRGRVVAQRAVFGGESLPYTEVDLAAGSWLKGSGPALLSVRVGGARSPEHIVEVSGAPSFDDGDDVVLLLHAYIDPRTGLDYYGIRGLEQGTLRIADAAGGSEQVIDTARSERVAWDEFRTRVAALVGAQEGGGK